jgi:ribulose kinase
MSIYDALNSILEDLASEQDVPFLSALTKEIHVLPDFNGNRSPMADPKARGVVSGLSLDANPEDLALLYLATVQSIAYGTKHIVDHCNAHGLKIDSLLACGGLSKNKLYIQQHADIVGCAVSLPRENEAVLLGAAVLGSVAAKKYSSVRDAMVALNAPGLVSRF